MAAQEIKVPDIGDFEAVEIIEVLVAPGDAIEEEQALITLESDKATLEVPATVAGTISEMKVAEGDTVSEGDVIALVEVADSGAEPGAPESAEDTAAAAPETTQADAAAAGGGGTEEVRVPDIGDFEAVEIIEVLVAAGDAIEEEQPLITL